MASLLAKLVAVVTSLVAVACTRSEHRMPAATISAWVALTAAALISPDDSAAAGGLLLASFLAKVSHEPPS
ncbi:MAG: hypothetical protein WBZ15_12570 [Mycobacterium sp.]|uniref:hypothetical protein n=1 Tax=Mycobacterium sp. TaxID=1785 RepID=UPI003C417A32